MQSTPPPPPPSSSSPPPPPILPPSFPQHLPKIELHAHLTGSIRPSTLHTIWSARLNNDPSSAPLLPDPLTVLTPTTHFDVKTFFPLFSSYIYKLLTTKTTLISSTNAVLADFRDDGVVYLELRSTPRDLEDVDKEGYVRTVLDCIAEFSASAEHQHQQPQSRGECQMRTHLILSIDRRHTVAEAMHTVELAIKYRDRGVVGVDLCGDPHAGGDVRRFRGAFARAREFGLGVTVHFAEVEKEGEGELRALLGFQPDRLGHVCHPSDGVRREVLDRGLGVELCVSCNVMAGLTGGGIRGHHFGWWWEKGGRVCLCTDDVGVFGSPLSNEYKLVAEAFGLGKDDLIRLARKPIECIFGPEKERQRLYQIFNEFETMQNSE